ncbi:BMP and activin membrane-bound inhibitor homolog isoform X2 [Cherax quadricarinatus]|uniref:BMP and activin membrane-bound inhibitor homolog isoform X2 n=1 Tax=Cherax quadricarinatus TaxID=27406 RepID=UPI00387EA0BB
MPSPVFSKGGTVRCYCNLPRCVTMGYMCKSILGACFTRNTPTPTHAYSQARKVYHRYAPMHGCVELLSMGRHAECLRKGEVHSMETRETPVPVIQLHPDPDLTCCNQDMCNYRNINVYVQVDGNYDSQTDMKHRDSEVMETLWFRAATIAVPIAGGFILIVLVLLASRMLAKENKRQRMAQVIEERCLKTPLYPGGTSDPIPHHPLYYHSPIIKNSSMAHMNFRAPFEEKPPNYRSPEISICNLEEIKPLNTKSQDEQWDQRDAESPLPS